MPVRDLGCVPDRRSGAGGARCLRHAVAGAAPNGGLMSYVDGSGAGALWSAPQSGFTDPDSQSRIFTAPYT